jgi:hypothetical protein
MTGKQSPNRPYYQVDPNMDRYIPNHIPAGERWWYVALSSLLIAWGCHGLWTDDLIVPIGKHGATINLHGAAAVIMFCAIVAAALNLLAVVIDHFDIRNNELTYRRFAFVTQLIGWTLFASAIIVHILR